MDDNLRQRYAPISGSDVDSRNTLDHQEQPSNSAEQPDVVYNATANRQDRQTARPRAAVAYIIIVAFYVLIVIFVHRRMNSYPTPKNKDNSCTFQFREENARKHLDILTGFGPRVVGSKANEKAKHYILDSVNSIIAEQINNISIDIDLQTANGSFILDFVNNGVGHFSSVYQNLENIVVKVSQYQEAESSVLVNCHYDTVVDSPGAGDDAASCCVMLEILRVLSQTHQTDLHLMHNVIFLFNSAEENILQTSHAFITQHKWAPSIKAFVNLDSAGAGGWELVFQTGPEHPWLVKAYIEAAPYPHATVVGQEIFQTGLIPSDTDFRIFRDYGAIPGLDIAHIKNGYVYHTKNDLPRYIPAGCMQRGGENILATLKHLASSSKLTNPGEDKHGSLVFFDFLGFFMVSYPYRMSIILNCTTFLYVVVAYLKHFFKDRTDYSNKLKQLSVTVIAMLGTWLIIVLAPLAIACFLSAIGRSLSYYTYNLNVVWIFMLPSVTAALAFHLVLKRTVFKNIDAQTVVVLLRDVNLLLWSFILALMTAKGLMSSYLPLLFILCPACVYTILQVIGLKPTNLVFSLVAAFVPSLYIVFMFYILLMFLIPIMGRSEMANSPDLLIGVISSGPVLICLPYQIGFVYTHSKVGRVISTSAVVFGLALTCILITPAGFPYSANPNDASVQRGFLLHIDRQFHTTKSQLIHKDAYVWYKPVDYLGGEVLMQYAPWLIENAKKATCDGVYCGRPYLFPVLPHVDARKTYDFPAPKLNFTRVKVELLDRIHLNDSMVRLVLSMSGPSHVTVFISELQKAKIIKWDFGSNVPVEAVTLPFMRHTTTYFIYYSHAGPANTTWNFSMDIYLECNKTVSQSLLRMGFAGHHLHGPNQLTPVLLLLEQELPPWMVMMRWCATYDEFIF
ncbi:endoplasmic reticulum metallopeptidase 1 [Biomphalaria glabrata]|nr:endoplasmic reticulum metallopeptidase 1 [Biomphalaria glabrata]